MGTKVLKKQPLSATSYAIISLLSFLIGACLVLFFVLKADKLIANGIDKMVFYILLIPIGLSAAAFLFGTMNSFAAYSGKSLNGTVKLGGPAALFALVVAGGFYLVPDSATFSVTVFVHGSGGKQDVVLRNQGEVMIDLEDFRRTEQLGDKGQATFPGIPAKYRNQSIPISISAKGYELADKNKEYTISGKSIYVEVKRDESLAKVRGRVSDSVKYLGGVKLSIEDLQTTSDNDGRFSIVIPPGKQKEQQTLIAFKEGYEIYKAFVYPGADEDIPIQLIKKHK